MLDVLSSHPLTCPLCAQVKYVVELAKALSRHPAVHRVDLLTRLIRDPKVASSYGELEEPLTEREGEMGGAYICRIKCGPVDTYVRWVGAGLRCSGSGLLVCWSTSAEHAHTCQTVL